MTTAALQPILCAPQPLPDGTAATAPDWVHLVPAGRIETVDGRGPYTLEDAAAVAAASMAGGARLPLDENHATDLAAPIGGPSPARGWIVEMAARADGLWGRVEWTATGRAMMADRAYRWISPAILCDATHRVLRVIRASLVNDPNLKGLAALHATRSLEALTETSMDLGKLRAALGLPADADEAAILAAATAAKSGVDKAAARLSTHAATLASIGEAVGATKDADATVVLAAVKAAVDPAKMVPAAAVAQLQSQLATLTQSVAREKAEAVVDAAIKAGKITAPQIMRDHYIARHMADPAAVEKELGAMVAIGLQSAQRGAAPAPGSDALSDDERKVVELMGVDAKAYVKTRADLAAREMF